VTSFVLGCIGRLTIVGKDELRLRLCDMQLRGGKECLTIVSKMQLRLSSCDPGVQHASELKCLGERLTSSVTRES